MSKYLVIWGENSEHNSIYTGYSQDDIINQLTKDGITDADVFIMED